MFCGMNKNLGIQIGRSQQNFSPQQREEQASLHTARERYFGTKW